MFSLTQLEGTAVGLASDEPPLQPLTHWAFPKSGKGAAAGQGSPWSWMGASGRLSTTALPLGPSPHRWLHTKGWEGKR